MPLTGYYSPTQSVYADEESSRNANSPGLMSESTGGGWTGTIGGQRFFFGALPSNATQAEAEAYYRSTPAFRDSAARGFVSPGAWNQLNPGATSAERDAYQDVYNDRQSAINFSRGSLAERSGLGPLGIMALMGLTAAGGAALTGALGGGGAAAGGATGAGTAGTAGTAAGGTAGAAGAAGAGGTAAGGGVLGASAIPEVVVTGSAGGAGAGAAGAAGGAGSFWNAMDAAASNTSSLDTANEAYLSGLEAPTASYGVDWMDLAKRTAGAMSQGQQQTPMMGGAMPGLLGGGGARPAGVASQRTQVFRSPLERYMALSRIGLLGSDD